MSDENEVMLGYSSSKNVTFRGEVPLGITRAEWKELDDDDRDALIDEAIGELIDVWVVGDDD